MHFSVAGLVLALAATTSASPLTERQSTPVNCNGQEYWVADLNNAMYMACVANTAVPGWPRAFDNKENFQFPTGAPYIQYPLTHSADYKWPDRWDGEEPIPAARYIATTAGGFCTLAGVVYARGNDFVRCTGPGA